MAELLYPLALLVCPVGMGLTRWLMMRSDKNEPILAASPDSPSDELRRVRAVMDQFRAPIASGGAAMRAPS